MAKIILITGAASGFGKGASIELARRGHSVIAGVQVAPQKTELMRAAIEAGVELQVVVLDITDEADRQAAFGHQVDVLVNNAGVVETGPIAEIPMQYVRRTFETNVFGTLALTQEFARQMVERGSGKIVMMTSICGLITVPFTGAYTAAKHALEGVAEALKLELIGTGVEICTVSPGPFATGFNDRGAETMMRWFDPEATLSPPGLLAQATSGLQNQFDPQIVVDALVRIAEEDASPYRTVLPDAIVPWVQAMQGRAWEAGRDDSLWVDATAG